MRVTIKDIARRTGLSPATVSLVLNNKNHKLSEETKEKVLHAVKEMKYRPNQLAVGLITKKTKTIGLIVPDISNMFFAELAKGAEIECQQRGYSIILCNTNNNPQKDVDYMNILVDRHVDGVVFAMSGDATGNKAYECFQILNEVNKPMVLLDRSMPEFAVPSVIIDHEQGGYLATKHLLELGHQKIGCITGPMGIYSAKQRFFGYIRALQDYKIPFDNTLVEEGDYRISSGYNLARNLIEREVTAIFACNDMMAYGVYKQVVERKMKVPDDLSIVGFDNVVFSEIMEVPLTSVNQPVYDLGKSAISKIIEMIDRSNNCVLNDVFKPNLVVRKSATTFKSENT